MKLLSRQVGVSAQDLWRALTVVGLITLFTLAVGCSPTPPQPKSDPLTQGSRHFAPPAGIGSGTGNTTSQPLDTSLNLIYHHGPVMHSVNAYLIFWAPPGSCFVPDTHELLLGAAPDSGGCWDSKVKPNWYRPLIERFFTDLHGSGYYQLLTQYYDEDSAGKKTYITDSITLGGSIIDNTTAYPAGGGIEHPLQSSDIADEVKRVMKTYGWTGGLTNAYFVFTAANVQTCTGDPTDDNAWCTFRRDKTEPQTKHQFCGYHDSLVDDANNDVIYAYIPDVEWIPECNRSNRFTAGAVSPYPPLAGPNGNAAADASIDIAAHELFELVTRPFMSAGGWFDSALAEIADKCMWTYPLSTNSDGFDLWLGTDENTGYYIVQEQWSNFNSSCMIR